MYEGAGSICLVANELSNLGRTGGIGRANWELAHLLAGDHWRVHVLYTMSGDAASAIDCVREQLACVGIGFTVLDEIPSALETRLPG